MAAVFKQELPWSPVILPGLGGEGLSGSKEMLVVRPSSILGLLLCGKARPGEKRRPEGSPVQSSWTAAQLMTELKLRSYNTSAHHISLS